MPAVTVTFRAFRRLNDPALAPLAHLRRRLDHRALPYLVPPRSEPALIDRLVQELAQRGALPIKELIESFEFFERVRRRMRGPAIADLCCGHGLTGMLFAIFSRPVERVLLLDRRQPDSFARVHEAALAVAPWIAGQVRYVETPLSAAAQHLPEHCAVVAVHACGSRTDRCIDLALARRARLALMPCCYYSTTTHAPPALREALGGELATDIDRTYRLHQAGYRVEWSEIPEAITDKNRILLAMPGPSAASPAAEVA